LDSTYSWVARAAGVVQLICTVVGLLLLIPHDLPAALQPYFPAPPPDGP
jgi:hypothetical protein